MTIESIELTGTTLASSTDLADVFESLRQSGVNIRQLEWCETPSNPGVWFIHIRVESPLEILERTTSQLNSILV